MFFSLFLSLNLTELFVLITGTTHLFFFKPLNRLEINFNEKLGLAASWIKTFEILLFIMLFRAFKDDSDRFFPPIIILTFLSLMFLRNFFCL